jgi:hypothetical protein
MSMLSRAAGAGAGHGRGLLVRVRPASAAIKCIDPGRRRDVASLCGEENFFGFVLGVGFGSFVF